MVGADTACTVRVWEEGVVLCARGRRAWGGLRLRVRWLSFLGGEQAGMLVVNGLIIIRKSGSRMVFEGSICKEYAAVRKLLLSQYHTL
eukprot:532892-Rhodomonas_salina.1